MRRRQYLEELFSQNPDNTFSNISLKGACENAGFGDVTSCQLNNDLEALMASGVVQRCERGVYKSA